MTTGSLLWRGMIVGFVAALLSFGLLKVVGEPAVDRAIAFESAMDEAKAKAEHDAAVAKGETPPPYEEEPELVSRPAQAGIGLFTGVTVYSIAFGGLFALAFAILLRPDGGLEPARDRRVARAQRLSCDLRRPDPQISGQPAVDRQPRHDRSAHRDLFRDDAVVVRLDGRGLECPQSPRRSAWRVECDAGRRRRLSCRGRHLRPCDAPVGRGSRRLPGRGLMAIPHGFARRPGDHVDGARARLWRLGRTRFRARPRWAGCRRPTNAARARP